MKIRLTVYLLATFIALYSLLIYVNFNLPVFQQLIAYSFYRSAEADPIQGGFSCITVNVSRSIEAYARNEQQLLGGSISGRSFKYFVNGRPYKTKIYSYIRKHFFCKPLLERQVYYFPLIPSWAVYNNNFPPEPYWNQFLNTTRITCIVLLLCVGCMLGLKLSGFNFVDSIKAYPNISIVIAAIALPLVLTPALIIFPVNDLVKELTSGLGRSVRLAVSVPIVFTFLYGPSVWLLSRYQWKWQLKIVAIPVFVVGHFMVMRISEGLVLKFIL